MLEVNQFDIPVALFMFKREHKTAEIVKRIGEVRPTKLYLIADGARNEQEAVAVKRTRDAVEQAIDWDCEIVKNYAQSNRGVYRNIGEGAKWVLSQEESAIFLEDDNMPELTFFDYCRELLEKYKDNERVLWICGTNYLGKYNTPYSYMFTQNLLPCGWASWSHKFLKYYDGQLETFNPETDRKSLRKAYRNKALAKQDFNNFCVEKERATEGKSFVSWDYQMAYTIRKYDLLGISPCNNQIKNIGIDSESIHGGTSFASVMTQRLCGMDSYPIEFPLKHPQSTRIDKKYERIVSNILLIPFNIRLRIAVLKVLRKLLGLKKGEHLRDIFKIRGRK